MPVQHCSILVEEDPSVASTGSHDVQGHDRRSSCCAPEGADVMNGTTHSNAKMPIRHSSVAEDPSESFSTQDALV
jgi:hypothetical protein